MEQHEGTVDSGALESRLSEMKKQNLQQQIDDVEERLAKLDKVGDGVAEVLRHYGDEIDRETTVYEVIGKMGTAMIQLDDMLEELRGRLDGLDD